MTPSIRIAMLIQAYHPHVGGAERQLMSLTPLLLSRGIDVRVFTRTLPPAPRHDVIAGARVTRLPTPGPKPLASLAYTLGAIAAMATWRPDIVHAHELLSPTTTALLAKRLFRKPIVAKVLRGGELGDVTKLRRTAHGRARLAAAIRGVDAFAVISREIDDELGAEGVQAERRCFLPNGVDTTRFAPAPTVRGRVRARLGVASDAAVALYCGRLSSEKRILDLARAWLSDSKTPADSELWLAGEGPLLEEVMRLAGPRVRVFGAIEKVEEILAAADVFVLPSDTEGLSNAMLEAMASGLPVVATAVGAAPELLADDKCGVLVPPGDMGKVLASLTDLLRQPQRRAELGAQGRAMVRRGYDLERTADGLVALYRTLLTTGRRRQAFGGASGRVP